jgi:hypothetical protein
MVMIKHTNLHASAGAINTLGAHCWQHYYNKGTYCSLAVLVSAYLPSSEQKKRRSDLFELVAMMLERTCENVRLEGAAPSVVSEQAHNPAIALIASEIGPASSLACSQTLEIEPIMTTHRVGGLSLLVRWAQAGLVLTPSMPSLRSIQTAITA